MIWSLLLGIGLALSISQWARVRQMHGLQLIAAWVGNLLIVALLVCWWLLAPEAPVEIPAPPEPVAETSFLHALAWWLPFGLLGATFLLDVVNVVLRRAGAGAGAGFMLMGIGIGMVSLPLMGLTGLLVLGWGGAFALMWLQLKAMLLAWGGAMVVLAVITTLHGLILERG